MRAAGAGETRACDRFRPCSLCLRANAECEPAEVSQSATGRPRRAQPRPAAYTPTRGRLPTDSPVDGFMLRIPVDRASSSDNREASSDADKQSPQVIIPESSRHDVSSTPTAPVYGESESAMGIVRRICRLGSQSIDGQPTSAIPDGELETHTPQISNDNQRLPISSILNCQFPGEETIRALVEDYFDTVHWFSLIIYEPHFRKRLATVQCGYAYSSDTPFILLLCVMLSMGAWYRSARTSGHDATAWRLLSNELLQVVESRLIHIMDHHSLTAIQTCILLGSHHVYHGRPNLSFSLLGATIKIAHALSLHKDVDHGDLGDIEERKRVWWTIYTWDRFASISYGRPLSIDDQDCDVSMPGSFAESPYFKQSSLGTQPTSILYSPYQIELSKLYVLTSPVLKMIFGTCSTRPSKDDFELRYTLLINDVVQKLVIWHSQLPSYLSLDLDQDYQPGQTTWESRAHVLQSLALQLTFDNLLIVIYRPFLSRQVERLSKPALNAHLDAHSTSPHDLHRQSVSQRPCDNGLTADILNLSDNVPKGVSEHWWNAAVRTAQVTHLPQLTQLATDSHLVAFMAMNLFHSAIVLVLNALSDPLSDGVQGIKRTVTRILRLQELVGRQSTLSSQSSAVLKNLIRLLLKREGEAMLDFSPSISLSSDAHVLQPTCVSEGNIISTVEDALRLSSREIQTIGHQTWNGTEPATSDAQHLSENLASLQQVFQTPNGSGNQHETFRRVPETDSSALDSAAHYPQAQGQPWTSFGEQGGPSFANDLHQSSNSTEIGGNNMFWLWDYNWDGLFDGGGSLS
ncbi:fungal-specific transcription factor domain-containing protein [Truncatella angustata]|uniref:Fungal-specific transcription factor domain-containing protein n=1 Tax=Truncatella angustata TaxID=152316 RepID=A0A9P8UG46_9PEZI|nr:fungal-specific transcription factor domain-containing protein [Truncatella angustata]KAH6651566.1 fungal-specific transcription factor domain-containing protein [Truncatella angustata]